MPEGERDSGNSRTAMTFHLALADEFILHAWQPPHTVFALSDFNARRVEAEESSSFARAKCLL